MSREPADFGGQCLVGECAFDASLLLPSSSYLGLPKAASYLYGTWRDNEGSLLRALRGVTSDASSFRYLFVSHPGHQLEVATSAGTAEATGSADVAKPSPTSTPTPHMIGT